jgi:hypothetical protein
MCPSVATIHANQFLRSSSQRLIGIFVAPRSEASALEGLWSHIVQFDGGVINSSAGELFECGGVRVWTPYAHNNSYAEHRCGNKNENR